jgi:two-component system OmpR family sensor kinase
LAVSLRRTLAVRYSLTMAVALLGIAVWAYLGMQRTLGQQLEESLHSSFEFQAFDLIDHRRITASPAPAERDAFIRQINRFVVLRDSSGDVLQSNNGLARELALDRGSFRRALAGERVLHTQPGKGGAFRVLSGPVAPGSPPGAAVLQVAASLAPLEEAGRWVLARVLATALLASLATCAGAWWLARSALAPVETIAAQAGAIQGAPPGGRITVHADTDELRGLVDVLNRMLDRLERASDWQRRIIRDLGHDLRTPITTMRAGLELALSGHRTPDQYRKVLGSTIEEVDRLALIGDALSLLGRLEAGEVTVALRATDLRGVAADAVARARERIGAHRVEFARPPEPVPALADHRLLGLTLDQLLDNAMRHTPGGTTIDVSVTARDGRAAITVEDDGPGVPDEMRPYLFERFYRADASRGRQGGPGLGLTVVAAITELHHGRVVAEAGRAGGLLVRLELPGR